jgi:predicted SprT family Zn-dependent metalloprotease
MFQERKMLVETRVRELIALANKKYNILLPKIEVRFDLQGRVAGWACGGSRFYLRINTDMMQNSSWDHIYNDTVPHEVAHLVCFHTNWDRGHGRYWRMVCKDLGGTGKRCHNESVTYAKGKTYHYTTSTGVVVSLSETRHKRVQQGNLYRYKDGGVITRESAYTTEQPQMVSSVPQTKTDGSAGKTNAERVREQIRFAKMNGHSQETVIKWAVETLGQSRSLARSYVINNWNKV